MINDSDRVTKGLLLLSSISIISICLILLHSRGVDGYEIHISHGLPRGSMILFLIPLLSSSLFLILKNNIDGYFYIGYAQLVLTAFLFLTLPLLRGYLAYGSPSSDVFAHIGFINDIVETGTLSDANWYPGIHILSFSLDMFIQNIEITALLLPGIFFTLYLLGIPILVKKLTGSTNSYFVGPVFALPLTYSSYHIATSPAVYSTMIIPTIIYLYASIEEFGSKSAIAAIVTSVAVVIYHPATTVILGIIIIVFVFTTVGISKLSTRTIENKFVGFGLLLCTLIGVLWFAWLLNFERFQGPIVSVFTTIGLVEETSTTVAESSAEAVQEQQSIAFIIRRFFELYGVVSIYGLIGLISTTIFLIDRKELSTKVASLTAQYYVSIMISFVFLFSTLVGQNVIRATRYTILISTIVGAIILVYLTISKERSASVSFVRLVITILLISSIILSYGVFYTDNRHVNDSEVRAGEWIVHHQSDEIVIDSFSYSNKLIMYSEGHDVYHREYSDSRQGFTNRNHVRFDFGETYSGETYVSTKSRGWHLYDSSNPEIEHGVYEYSKEQLANDRRHSNIYVNSDVNWWISNT